MDGLKWALGCVLAIALQVPAASAQLVYPGICERTNLSADTQAYCDLIVGLTGDELAEETARENERRRIARNPARAGYFDTVWPSEHTDLWRSHAALDAGLPADFDPGRLAVSTVHLNLPVWGYTRKRDEVFVIGGQPVALDGFTQAIKLGRPLTNEEFALTLIGSLLNPSIPYVAKIQPREMQLTRLLHLTGGSTVNYSGGLLIHQNGFVYAVSQSVLYKINPRSMTIAGSVTLPLVGDTLAENFWTNYNGIQVLASGQIVLKGFHSLNSNIPGWLLLVNPDDLSIPVKSSASVFTARLTIEQTVDGRAWVYHSNATESIRYEITSDAFVLDESWTRSYRVNGDGTTNASSPLIFGQIGQIVFADDTEPTPTVPIHLYAQPVNDPPDGPLERTPAFTEDIAGFNFFMVAGDPFLHQMVVYYDPINNLLSAHDVDADGTLTLKWEREGYKTSASPAISPDRDLLYIDDYLDDHDEFVMLRLSTGDELARVRLDASLPTIGTIFLGMNNDVYIISSETGGADGLVSRVHLRPDRHRHRHRRGRRR